MSKHRSSEVEPAEGRITRSRVRRAAVATGTVAATGAGLFIAYKNGISYDDARTGIDAVMDGQFIPKPSAHPEAVDGMVAVNEGLRNIAVPTMLGALGMLAVVKWRESFANEYEMSKHDYAGTDTLNESANRLGKTKRAFAGVGLAATTVLITGGSSGIEHEISNGPLRPIHQTFDLLSDNAGGQRSIIVQSENNSFMDDADVNKARLHAFAERAAKIGVNVVPFNKTLQNIDNNPALIVTVPDALFTRATGEVIDKSCDTIPIMLDESNTTEVGGAVEINGVKARVVEKISDSAQMNRDVAIVAETDLNCIEKDIAKTTYGAIISGGEPGEAEALFASDPLHDESVMISEEAFQDNNRDFWRKNGTPLVLELMGLIGGLSFIAMSSERRNALQRNIQEIAALHSQGVGFKTIKRIESIRALRDSLKATAIAAPFMPVVAGAFNAAEVGLRVGIGIKEIAVGGTIALAAKLVGSRWAVSRFKNSLNVEKALKG